MKTRTLIALAVIAGFAATAQAAGDKASGDKASSGASSDKATSSAAAGASKTGNAGADSMFNALDKNHDGFLSRDEVKGSPHDKDFATLDKNKDGKLTPEEHASAKEHQKDNAASGASTAPSSDKAQSSGAATTPKSKY